MSTTEEKVRPPEEEELESEVDAIAPPVNGGARAQLIGIEGVDGVTYMQRPLSFFGKMRLAQVLGKGLRQAMAGGGGSALASMLGSSEEELTRAIDGEDTTLDLDEIKETARFMEAIAVLLEYAPGLLVDVYLIALWVPTDEVDWARETMQLGVEEGGLSDEDGFAILQTFFDQNWEALRSFFATQVLPLLSKYRGAGSREQPPSNRTQRRTRSGSKSSSSGRGKGSS